LPGCCYCRYNCYCRILLNVTPHTVCYVQVYAAGNPQYGQLGGGSDHSYNAKDSEWLTRLPCACLVHIMGGGGVFACASVESIAPQVWAPSVETSYLLRQLRMLCARYRHSCNALNNNCRTSSVSPIPGSMHLECGAPCCADACGQLFTVSCKILCLPQLERWTATMMHLLLVMACVWLRPGGCVQVPSRLCMTLNPHLRP
jgi:hypothetical protein